MASVIARRNSLLDKIDKATQRHNLHNPLIAQINEWEDMMIEKIKIVADNTRQQVSQLVNSKRTKLSDDFKRFSQELANLRETENFIEADLNQMKYKLNEFNHELKHITKPVLVELHTELSNQIVWNQLIYVEEKSNHTVTQQQLYQQVEEEQEPIVISAPKQPPKI
ncbi:unnamed protein product [Adineta steineri]|uniref:Uncharacterized protein n=2 Tax=Adineta steineri TaxID=433720 RepID=A0A814KP31_9BILA|nr:unnamed protein product [Adineta steineri]